MKFLIAMAMVIASLFIVTPAQAAGTITCKDPTWVQQRVVGASVTTIVRANYKTCQASGHRWVRLISYQGKYNVNSGNRLTCSKFSDPFRAIWVNFYFWDQDGRNWNPAGPAFPFGPLLFLCVYAV